MKPAIAFDATGVFFNTGQAVRNATKTVELLRTNNIPFVVITNAGGRTEQQFADRINRIMNTDIFESKHIIQAHTPMQMIYQYIKSQQLLKENELIVISGSEISHELADQYGFENYLTIPELASIYPQLVPLTIKAGYPINMKENIERVKHRFRCQDTNELLKRKIKYAMLFSNPFLYEEHLQILSDILITSNGILGTQRQPQDEQFVKFFVSNNDFLISHRDDELPNLTERYALEQKLKDQAQTDNIKNYMVGDFPETDIKGGNENGYDSILVKTGIYKEGMETYNPKYIVNDVNDAVDQILKLHY